MEIKEFSLKLDGKTLTIKKSDMAGQANGSVFAQLGDTVVLATAVMGRSPKEGIDYFPLIVDYEEKFYAAGRIIGSRFIKREGKASQDAILTARLIDRAIRPLFDHALRHDVQIVTTVLSVDLEHDPDTVAMIAASCALAVSNIPWSGPIGAVRIAKVSDKWIINPTYEELKLSDLDLVVAGVNGRINMIEAGAKEVPEDVFAEAFETAQKEIDKLIDFQNEIMKATGKEKIKIEKEDLSELAKEVREFIGNRLQEALYNESDKIARMEKVNALKKELATNIAEIHSEAPGYAKIAEGLFEDEIDRLVHENIIQNNKRPDGRKIDEIRTLDCMVSLLPRTHGSGLFMRGNTHVLSILTLGSPGDQQLIDTMEAKETKRFMHHYNFPSFSVGEIGPMRGPSRRDIGHGALAERALAPVIPEQKEFPYTIRLVSETLSSNGSSSMASVCGSILALMDGGVPIKNMVAGIAMGLMSSHENGDYKILTDIQGPEDHHGDMDLKVAGTDKGITAVQMDVKIEGISKKIFVETLAQARKARMEILDKMRQVLPESRPELSKYAPRIIQLQINPEKIRDVIGPGGKVINEIIDETGVSIDIEDDGSVFITSANEESARKAEEWVKNIAREFKVGEIFQGKVKKIMDFGAFVEIYPGTEGLVHISKLAEKRVDRVEDVVGIGDVVPVKLMEIDSQGRFNFSMKDALKEQNQ